MWRNLAENIEKKSQRVIDLQTALVSIPALGPTNGGDGELEKAEYLIGQLSDLNITNIERIDAPDDRTSSQIRPNVAAVIPGQDTEIDIGH